MPAEIDETFQPSRLRRLLDHFADIEDPREAPKLGYPLREVPFLVVAATIADCQDYDEIALLGITTWSFCDGFPNFISVRPAQTGCEW